MRSIPTAIFLSLLLTILGSPCAQAESSFDPLRGLSAKASNAGLMVVQCNIYIGGKFSDNDKSKTTWRTAENFAREIRTRCSDASVIGMEEVIPPDSARKSKELLERHTGKSWGYTFEEQGVDDKGSGLAVFWRTDRVALVRRLGKVAVDYLDNRYVVRFMGVLLKDRATNREFAMFCGKFTWAGARRAGHEITEADRVQEVRRFRDWVRVVLKDKPAVARIVATDLNSSHDSPTYREMAKEFEPDGSKDHTHSSLLRILGRSIMIKRLDYLWHDRDAGPRATGGFLTPVGRSEHFGSDHRAVWARLRI